MRRKRRTSTGRDESSSKVIVPNPEHKKKKKEGSPSPSPQTCSSPPRKPSASYLEIPNLAPKIKLLCEILSNTPSTSVEASLDQTGINNITREEVEEILKLSYSFPGPSVKFFRWAGRKLNDNHSPYAWNLVVDLLGKNLLFEAMWDAIKSMKREGLLSLATFASVFSSYVVADRVDEAIMSFEVMEQYGCHRDIVALNSLTSAICRQKGQTVKARDFLVIAKDKIPPDPDTYAILLEGWENEGDVTNAHRTFGEMVLLFGWNPSYIPAYDAFLKTLLMGPDGVNEAINFFQVLRQRRCFPGISFFRAAMDKLVKAYQTREAWSLWEGMMSAAPTTGCRPDTQMYNSMITLHCHLNHVDDAYNLLDEMVFNGVFPDSQSYNLLLQFFLKVRKLQEVLLIFNEMVKNEFIPNQENCTGAIKVFIDVGDPDMAIKVWKCMLHNEMSDLEDIGNLLIVGLRELNRLSEARKYAEDMIERGIKLNSKTLSKLKQSYTTLGKTYVYDELLRKWKSKSSLAT